MKKHVIFAAALAAFAAPAFAQNSVTLYGLIDEGFNYTNNVNVNGVGKTNYQLASGYAQGSRWGLKGSEDLGGGLKAIFTLENGFDVNNGRLGQGGRMFGRQAFVGLTSDRYGTLTFGRQYDPLIDLVQGITADNYLGSVFATPGDVDNYDNSFRVDNAVKYTSAVYSGLQFSAMYSFGGIAGSTGAAQSYSAAVSYNNGPFSVAGGYFHATNSPASNSLRSGWTSSSDGTFDGPINSGYASAHSFGIARVAGQYVAGLFTFGVGYSNAQYRRDASSVFGSNEHYNTGQGFVNYQATSALLVGVGYSYTRSGGDTSATYHQVSAGADYNLSKRTDVYLTAAYQHASGQTGDGNGGSMAAQASIGSYGYAGTSSQTMVNLGLRHRF